MGAGSRFGATEQARQALVVGAVHPHGVAVTIPAPRELVLALVEIEHGGVAITFDLGDPFDLDVAADWVTYGLEVTAGQGTLVKHFGVRFSPAETKAFVFDFPSTTQANYDSTHVENRGTSVVARLPDSTLATDADGLLSAFRTIEGDDTSVDVPVQLLRVAPPRNRQVRHPVRAASSNYASSEVSTLVM